MPVKVIAMYESADQAQKVVNKIVGIGCSEEAIDLLSNEGHAERVLVAKLTSHGMEEDEAALVAKAIGRGCAMVAVDADEEEAKDARDIMEKFGARDFHELAAEMKRSEQGESSGEQSSQSVPVVEEEVSIGTRKVQRGGVRVTSTVSERPVKESVTLREESVDVERKQADRGLSPEEAEEAFKEQSIELTETAEEAVINKEARVVGEVSLQKTSEEHEEEVTATARRTEVDVSDVETGKRRKDDR